MNNINLIEKVRRYFELETLIDTHDYNPSDDEIDKYRKVRVEIIEELKLWNS